ncbi:conserved hypothetical protein [Neospora caninum Liverpool]|uniref:Uncharacterized protein n=1 Tax=Neospora caninum (strain Liverpool) TaxID=572307 RepID=F0VK86_NEOCL|nr:conserved hypothetical protein [Neospora caninum Liverpool]CBZ54487.1 conserved hypothetical protein [Neospora caninum Liverpool]CEL69200.1 TPA: hypothetical protein BN1204_049160 [Neospora caninum Liverpool]|eukprot:XP_003884517.1 conserved hypothetical protein [Neospora caninum Liverpool]
MGNEQSTEGQVQTPDQVPNADAGHNEVAEQVVSAQEPGEGPKASSSKDPPPVPLQATDHGFSRYLSGLGDFFSGDSSGAVSASSEVVNNIGSYMSLEAVKEALTGEEDRAEGGSSSAKEEPSQEPPADDVKEEEDKEQQTSASGITSYLTTSLDGVSGLFRSMTQEGTVLAAEASAAAQDTGASLQSYLTVSLEGVTALFKSGSSENNEVPPSVQDTGETVPLPSADAGVSATEETSGVSATEETSGVSATEETSGVSAAEETSGVSATEETSGVSATEETSGTSNAE